MSFHCHRDPVLGAAHILWGALEMKPVFFLLVGVAASMPTVPGITQIIGSVDNFDCVNDTGETAEGFEMDIEDVSPSDITRAFPSNFSGQEYVQRFGLPTISAYDNTASGGKKGVLITWAASWDGSKWAAKWGSYNYLGQSSGDGVKFVANPSKTQGDQCWLLGQGFGYATSGCDHFGFSFLASARPGAIHYHWKIPDPANPGQLINAAWNATGAPIAPAPIQAYVPPPLPGNPAIVHAVAQAPEQPEKPEAQWGEASWLLTYTYTVPAQVDLDQLQANLLLNHSVKGVRVRKNWQLLQKAPLGGEAAEKQEVDDDPVDAAHKALIKRYVYYTYSGRYDPETHEALCAVVPKSPGDCLRPFVYDYIDPATGKKTRIKEQGRFMGAHNAEFVMPPI